VKIPEGVLVVKRIRLKNQNIRSISGLNLKKHLNYRFGFATLSSARGSRGGLWRAAVQKMHCQLAIVQADMGVFLYNSACYSSRPQIFLMALLLLP
jgi:hypothetical protein